MFSHSALRIHFCLQCWHAVGLKYDANKDTCVADTSPKCDSAHIGNRRVLSGKLMICTMYMVGSDKKYSFAVLQNLDASLGTSKDYPGTTCKVIKVCAPS